MERAGSGCQPSETPSGSSQLAQILGGFGQVSSTRMGFISRFSFSSANSSMDNHKRILKFEYQFNHCQIESGNCSTFYTKVDIPFVKVVHYDA